MDLHKIYSIIEANYPSELYPSAEPYRLDARKIKGMLDTFINKVNGIFKTQGIDVVIVRLDRIKVDYHFQSRIEMNEETINRYKDSYANGAMFPPVDIGTIDGYREERTTSDDYSLDYNSPSSSPSYYLLDGFHRYSAKKRLPLWNRYILAVVHRGIPEADAVMLSIKNNRINGLGYTNKDKAKVLDTYISMKQYIDMDGHIKSFRRIAKDLLIISERTVRDRIKKHYPTIAEQIKAAYFGTTADTEQKDESAEIDEAETNEATGTKSSLSEAEKALNRALSTLSKRAEVIADRNAAMHYERSLLALLNASRKKWGLQAIERAEDYEEDF